MGGHHRHRRQRAVGQHRLSGTWLAPPELPRIPMSLGILGLYCARYGVFCIGLEVPQAIAIVRRVLRRKG